LEENLKEKEKSKEKEKEKEKEKSKEKVRETPKLKRVNPDSKSRQRRVQVQGYPRLY
jgi:hypothetical protein